MTELGSDFVIIFFSALLVAASCSLVGFYLTLRKQALFGDALSHSLLPGLIIAFIISDTLGGWPMLMGALFAGMTCSFLIESIRNQGSIKEDTSMGIVFTSMFALGVMLLSLFADRVHIDTQCVLFGELLFVPLDDRYQIFENFSLPVPLGNLFIGFLILAFLCRLFHKEFVMLAFHEGIAQSLGLPTKALHYLLMILVSISIVTSFELVGAILVIGFLIIPPSFGKLFSSSFGGIYAIGLVFSALSIALALPVSFWLNLNPASLIVVFQFLIFCLTFATKYIQSLGYFHKSELS